MMQHPKYGCTRRELLHEEYVEGSKGGGMGQPPEGFKVCLSPPCLAFCACPVHAFPLHADPLDSFPDPSGRVTEATNVCGRAPDICKHLPVV